MKTLTTDRDHLEACAAEANVPIEFTATAAFCVINRVQLTAPLVPVAAEAVGAK